VAETWWQSFFDLDYLKLWSQSMPESRTTEEVDFIWRTLALGADSRVLDAPCGYGRIARVLAERGASVVGVDQSKELLDHAERTRGDLAPARLRYLRHDLRQPLDEGEFDAALNVFTSLGYGNEEDDVAVIRTLGRAVRPGGTVLIETAHRDTVAALLSREGQVANRLADGTLVFEQRCFDPVAGRVETTWYWQGPAGSGQKSASLRVYTITELVRLIEQAGLRFREALQSRTGAPFEAKGPLMGGRGALLAERAARAGG
jgi:SAM-dependent methyltransferase